MFASDLTGIETMTQSVLEMAKDLVMAQIQAGALLSEDMHKELQKTYASLMELKAREESGDVSPVPATGPVQLSSHDGEAATEQPRWKKSIKKYTIECLECGIPYKQLSVRHLKDHNLDTRSYRAKYGIPRMQPLSARATTAIRKEIVQRSRPWEKAPTFKKAQALKAGTKASIKTHKSRRKVTAKAS
jgi:predicted transcriptional regulator